MTTVFSAKFWRLMPVALWRKYPIASVFMIIATLALACNISGAGDSHIFNKLFLIAIMGMATAVTKRNYERMSLKVIPVAWKIIIAIIFITHSLYILSLSWHDHQSQKTALPLILILIAATMPHIKDKCATRITQRIAGTIGSMCNAATWPLLATCVTLIAFILLYAPLSLLTDLELNENFILTLVTFVWCTAILTVFLLREAFQLRKKIHLEYELMEFLRKPLLVFNTYISLVMCLYIIIILFKAELPRGYISTVSSLCSILALATYIACDGNWTSKQKPVWQKMRNAIPWMMLPLQVLMTIALARRISDYGVTIDRVYGIVLNLWFYVTSIYLIISRDKQLKWIPISFAITAFIIVCSPIGAREYVKFQLRYDIKHEIGIVEDKRQYLHDNFGQPACEGLDTGRKSTWPHYY